MCRMLGYVGPPIAPGELIVAPPHSLYRQSYQPREMTSGTVNADGFGAALWLDDGRPDPAVYRTAQPIWADGNLELVAQRLRVRAALAAVRSATPGIGYQLANVQPFARGRLALVHNGFIESFHGKVQRALSAGLTDEAYAAIGGTSDSEHLLALLLDEQLREPSLPLAAALRGAIGRLRVVCAGAKVSAVATLIASDGDALVGCRWATGPAAATLYLSPMPLGGQAGGAPAARGEALGYCVASEPLDRGDWQPIPPQHLFVARPAARPSFEALA